MTLVTLAVLAMLWPLGRGWSARTSDNPTILESEIGPAPKVLSLVVEQSRPDDPDHSSMIGVSSWEGRGGELIRVTARLDHPAYCYLMALDPDGQIRLVDPPDGRSPPSRRSEIHHPSGPGRTRVLPDAAGLQGWLLVAAARPLPPYDEWFEASMLRWRTVVAEGVLRFDGLRVQRFRPGPCRVDWSLADSPRPFAQLCMQLSRLPELDAVEAIVYPVRPKAH